MTFTSDHLVEAVQRQQVATIDERAAASCRRIAAVVDAERRRLDLLLSAAGCPADEHDPVPTLQRHEIEFGFTGGHTVAGRAADLLEHHGYKRAQRWHGGAERSFWRTADHVTLLHSDDVTTVVRLRWASPRRRSVISRVIRPTAADWAAVDLPASLWWLYTVVRPVRLVLERLGLRSDDHSHLEPFLTTPRSLTAPLLDVAEVSAADVVADIGCGDGRIVIEASRRFGCRSVGIEQSAELAATAQHAVAERELSELVHIIRADGFDVDLNDVTVVVLFLPIGVAGRIVPALLDRLQPGARVVLHEQSPLPVSVPAPDRSTAIVADDAITVAHLWSVPHPSTGKVS